MPFDEKALEKFIDSKLNPPAEKVNRRALVDTMRKLARERRHGLRRLPGMK